MRHLLAALSSGALLAAATASATPVFHHSGSNMSYGKGSHRDTVFMSTHNPAAATVNLAEDADVRLGVLPNVGGGYEVGQADEFAEELEDLVDFLDQDNPPLNEARQKADEFNALLPTIAEEGYVRGWGVAHVPAFPLVIRTGGWLEGALSFDINFAAEGWGGFFDDEVTLDPITNEPQTASAVYVKGAEIREYAAGYSRPLAEVAGGQLLVGGRLKYLEMALTKQVVALESVADDEDIEDVIRDNYDDNQRESSGVTVDTGVMWVQDNLRAGLTITNLTEPAFKYNEVGFDCNDITDPVDQDNCYTALFFADRFDRRETHVMERQATVEGGLTLWEQRLALSGSLDLNAATDPVAAEHQYFSVAAGWEPHTWWIPGVRLGYRKNMAGEKLDMLTGGLRLLRVMTLDVAYGLDKVKYDGESFPRTAAVSLGVEAQF